MKKTERFTKITLIVLAILAAAAITLQIINSETSLIETVYEIIVFTFAVTALVLAVVQGIYNTQTSNELHKLAREINDVLKTERINLKISSEVAREIKEEIKANHKN